MSSPTPPAFHPVPIAELRDETPELFHLTLQAPAEFLSAYTIPGQYVQMQLEPHKPGFFAIASGPSKERLEFLIKRGAPAADAIAAKKPGETLHVTAPSGKGYALMQAQGRDVYLVGVGSGLAPLRALMHTLLSRRSDYGKIHLLYGARKSHFFPYSTEVKQWANAGVAVTQVCSRPDAGSWSGATGHVQDYFKSTRPTVAAGSAVFVCGMKPMVEGVKAVFGEFGIGSDRIFQNF
jgi:NAD(P)H-flavin reductase